MKKCELCQLPARLYCESDQASLCFGCDLKVHKANFLVARHSRTLLCKTCQSPTPWKACGVKLGCTETECEKCMDEIGGVYDEMLSYGSGEEMSDWEEDEDEDADVEEEEGENQVVPCSSFSSHTNETSFSSSVCESRTASENKRICVHDDVIDYGLPNDRLVSSTGRSNRDGLDDSVTSRREGL